MGVGGRIRSRIVYLVKRLVPYGCAESNDVHSEGSTTDQVAALFEHLVTVNVRDQIHLVDQNEHASVRRVVHDRLDAPLVVPKVLLFRTEGGMIANWG